ncbi:MAG: hypothetical protein OWS74_06655 [Firmicutes bacterium]|nr:hypothetical protein [Bacillota bacterium]
MIYKPDEKNKKDVFEDPTFLSRDFNLFIPSGFFTLHRVNFGEDGEKKKSEKVQEITAFDIETNGKEIFLGVFDGQNYKYTIIRKPEEIVNALRMLNGKSYFYGDYDLPVMLSNFVTLGSFSKNTKKMFGENFFIDDSFDVRRFKNYYAIMLGDKIVSAVNLLQFYSESLYSAYVRYYEQMKQFGFDVFDEVTLNEWKEDKEKRKDFDKLDFNNQRTVDEIARYNKLDVIATYQLALLKDRLFGIDVKTTLPSTSVSYILDSVRKEYNTQFVTGLKPYANIEELLNNLYKGGLFDSNELGSFQKVWKYDVNSMYPYMMTLLPELELVDNFREFEVNENPLLKGTQFNPDAKYVYVYRLTLRQRRKYVSGKYGGMLLRMGYVRGSFFDFELSNGIRGLDPDVSVVSEFQTLKFRIKRHQVFKRIIEDIYGKRLQYKRERNPIEKVYKLILNSSYGKFAERLGMNTRYQNVVYASMITALGRTFIQNVDGNAVSYLTDSVITKKPINEELVGDELGKLKLEGEGPAIVIGNGQYILDDEHEKMVKLRGFNVDDEVSEKVIRFIGSELAHGRIVRVSIPTRIMIRNLNQYKILSQEKDVLIGILSQQDKVISPLNIKQKYSFSGNWLGQMYKSFDDFDKWKKDWKKKMDQIEPVDLNSIM